MVPDHCGDLLRLRACYIKLDITNTIGVFECSNDIIFIRCMVAMLLFGIVDTDRKGWPNIISGRSYGCAGNSQIETEW